MTRAAWMVVLALLLSCAPGAGHDEPEAESGEGEGEGGEGEGEAGEGEGEAGEGEGEGGEGEGETEGEQACDGFDDDGDARVDEGCDCDVGDTQPCYPGARGEAGIGACVMGTQTCESHFEFGEWSECQDFGGPSEEACGDGIDNDCAGGDEQCEVIDVAIDIEGDCVTATCPESHPYPIGCDVTFEGGDSRGCVAYEAGSSEVYFQEGDVCNAGHLSGTLTCSTEPGDGLDAENCPINKEDPYYETDPDDCPDDSGPFG